MFIPVIDIIGILVLINKYFVINAATRKNTFVVIISLKEYDATYKYRRDYVSLNINFCLPTVCLS